MAVVRIIEITETTEGDVYTVVNYHDPGTDAVIATEDFVFVGLAAAKIVEVDYDEYGRVEIDGARVFPQVQDGSGGWGDRADLASARVNVSDPDEDWFTNEILDSVIRYGEDVVDTGKMLGRTRGRGPDLMQRKLQPDGLALHAAAAATTGVRVAENLAERRTLRRFREEARRGR